MIKGIPALCNCAAKTTYRIGEKITIFSPRNKQLYQITVTNTEKKHGCRFYGLKYTGELGQQVLEYIEEEALKKRVKAAEVLLTYNRAKHHHKEVINQLKAKASAEVKQIFKKGE